MKQSKYRKFTALVFLEITFFSLLIISTALAREVFVLPTTIFWILFALAVFRAARTISFNEVAEWLRDPFCVVEKDSCGAGENVAPRTDKGEHIYVMGSLLACPICTGTWVSMIMFVLYSFFPNFGTALIIVLGLAGASELLHYLGEILSWGGRYARVESGRISPDKEN